MEEIETRSRRIDALKGMVIFFVPLGHAIIFYPVDLHEDPACQLVFDFVSSPHMELFFLLSGYCFRFRGGELWFLYALRFCRCERGPEGRQKGK